MFTTGYNNPFAAYPHSALYLWKILRQSMRHWGGCIAPNLGLTIHLCFIFYDKNAIAIRVETVECPVVAKKKKHRNATSHGDRKAENIDTRDGFIRR
jgi:hypothetical protein